MSIILICVLAKTIEDTADLSKPLTKMMDKPTVLRTALWLMPRPSTPLAEALHQTIIGLKPLFDDGCKFEPHVTLTTDVLVVTQRDVESILDGVAAAAKSVPKIEVVLQNVTYGSQRFRKVVLEAKHTPTLVSLATICRERYVCLPKITAETEDYAKLDDEKQRALQMRASEVAEAWAKNEFRPHLSLVYSNVHVVPEAQRHTIEQRLEDAFGDAYKRGIGWNNGRIALVDCEGPVEQWTILSFRDL